MTTLHQNIYKRIMTSYIVLPKGATKDMGLVA